MFPGVVEVVASGERTVTETVDTARARLVWRDGRVAEVVAAPPEQDHGQRDQCHHRGIEMRQCSQPQSEAVQGFDEGFEDGHARMVVRGGAGLQPAKSIPSINPRAVQGNRSVRGLPQAA